MRRAVLGIAAPVALGFACGGRSHVDQPEAAAGSGLMAASGRAGSGGSGRVPDEHRATGESCPSERGSNEPVLTGLTCDVKLDCEHDADCPNGQQGRCVPTRFHCVTGCSYDACYTDADCADDKPCACRPSPSDATPNRCLTASNCRVDADCGPAGYCSPSLLVGLCVCTSVDYCAIVDPTATCTAGSATVSCSCGDSCGHGYYCHTPNDECIDDSDCAPGTVCGFDLAHQNWICATCQPVP